jgi:hypothetical protein
MHAVCGELVRRHAFVLGLSPQVRALPPLDAARVGREALDDALSRVGPELDELAARVAQSEWRALVGRVLAAAWVNGIDADGLQRSARHSVDRLGACFVPGDSTRAARLLAELERVLPVVEAESGASRAASDRYEAVRVALRAARTGALGWRDQLGLAKALGIKRFERDFPDLLRLLRDHTDADALRADLAGFADRVFGVAADAELEFGRRKRDARLLDFDDLLASARVLLDDSGVAAILERDLDLVVVDEFQDVGLRDWALRRADPGSCHANLDAVRQIAASYAQSCAALDRAPTLAGLLDAFRRVEEDESGGLQAASPRGDAVVVTTWHGSKGLEWPVVVLAGLDDEPRDDVFGLHVEGPDRFDASNPLAGRWLRLCPGRTVGTASMSRSDARAREPRGGRGRASGAGRAGSAP